jgi:SSS family solute:Na+ symporter
LPESWNALAATDGMFRDEHVYAIIVLTLTSIHAVKGGMVSVVVTEVTQFLLLTVTSITVGLIALFKVSPDMIQKSLPDGWLNPLFGWTLEIDWAGVLAKANDALRDDGNELFGITFGLMVCKGVLASLAGPAPNYDMRRVLATRNPARPA